MRSFILLIGFVLLYTVVLAQVKPKTIAPAKKPANNHKQPTPFQLSMARGLVLYKKECLACHQSDGYGVPNLNPPLIKTTYVLGNKAKLINIVLKGMNEEIEINGDYYSNPMPPHNYLSNQQIADILTYVRNSFGNKASSITSVEVKNVRENIKR